MAENIQDMNLYQRLAKIRQIADVAKKTKKGFNYTYSDITDILAKVTAGMNKYGVSLVPRIVPESGKVEQVMLTNTKTTKAGEVYDQKTTEYVFTGDLVYRWLVDENPDDFLDVAWFAAGSQSDPSQAIGGSLTYSARQFLTNYFQIAQSDLDPDDYRSKQKAAAAAEDKMVAEEIIKKLDAAVREYLSEHKDDADKVKEFMKKVAKGGNYFTITDPVVAAKLLEDFTTQFSNAKN